MIKELFKILVIAVLLVTSTFKDVIAKEVTVVSNGGSWQSAQERAMFKPFTSKTGIKVNAFPDAESYALVKLRTQVESKNITWDVINLRPETIAQACDEGLIEKFNIDEVLSPSPNGTPASKDFFTEFQIPCTAPMIVYSIQFAYNTKKYGTNGPKTVVDIFDVKKFPGKRGLQKVPYNNLEWALIADGVSRTKVREVLATEKGLDRAFAMMDRIKDHIIWWDNAATGIQQLASGEVDIATNYNGRLWVAAVNEGQPIKVIWDHQIYTVTSWVVVKGRMSDEVRSFLRSSTSTTSLAEISKIISYGPTRRSSVAMNKGNWNNLDNGQDMTSAMPTYADNMNTAFSRDGQWWADNGERINKRWEAWLLK